MLLKGMVLKVLHHFSVSIILEIQIYSVLEVLDTYFWTD